MQWHSKKACPRWIPAQTCTRVWGPRPCFSTSCRASYLKMCPKLQVSTSQLASTALTCFCAKMLVLSAQIKVLEQVSEVEELIPKVLAKRVGNRLVDQENLPQRRHILQRTICCTTYVSSSIPVLAGHPRVMAPFSFHSNPCRASKV